MRRTAMSSVFGSVWILRRGETVKRGLLGRKGRLKQAR